MDLSLSLSLFLWLDSSRNGISNLERRTAKATSQRRGEAIGEEETDGLTTGSSRLSPPILRDAQGELAAITTSTQTEEVTIWWHLPSAEDILFRQQPESIFKGGAKMGLLPAYTHEPYRPGSKGTSDRCSACTSLSYVTAVMWPTYQRQVWRLPDLQAVEATA